MQMCSENKFYGFFKSSLLISRLFKVNIQNDASTKILHSLLGLLWVQ